MTCHNGSWSPDDKFDRFVNQFYALAGEIVIQPIHFLPRLAFRWNGVLLAFDITEYALNIKPVVNFIW